MSLRASSLRSTPVNSLRFISWPYSAASLNRIACGENHMLQVHKRYWGRHLVRRWDNHRLLHTPRQSQGHNQAQCVSSLNNYSDTDTALAPQARGPQHTLNSAHNVRQTEQTAGQRRRLSDVPLTSQAVNMSTRQLPQSSSCYMHISLA